MTLATAGPNGYQAALAAYLSGKTVKVMLTTSAYTFNIDTHQFRSSVTNEVSGTGYSAGGQTVANAAFTYVSASDAVMLDGDDVTWASSTITARRAVFYIDTGTASTSPIVAVWDFESDQSSADGNFTLQIHANGINRITAT